MASTTPCCLDCRWCLPQAEVYGATSYRCMCRDRVVRSAFVLERSCDRYERAPK